MTVAAVVSGLRDRVAGAEGQAGCGIAEMLAETETIAAAHGHDSGIRRRRRRAPGASRAGVWRNPAAQRLGLTRRQDGGLAGTSEQPGPGDEVGGDLDKRETGLVDLEFSGRESAQAGVLGVPDAVLDPS